MHFGQKYMVQKILDLIKALIASLGVFGSALGPGISGMLIDYGFNFSGQMYIFGLCTLIGCILAAFASLTLKWDHGAV